MLKEWCLKMWLISKNQWRPVSAPTQIDDHDMKLSDFSRIKQPSQVLVRFLNSSVLVVTLIKDTKMYGH